jgi:hypothetical protein
MKSLRILIAALILMFVAAPVFAASLSHAPAYRYVAIPAGSQAAVPVTVTISDVTGGTYFLWFVDSVDGNLPMEWIRPAKKTTFLNRFWNSSSTNLMIAVPKDVEPGTYASYVYSKAMRSHEYADPGRGILIEVFVPSNCSGKPVVEIASLSPEVIWPPNHSMEVVTVNGTISMPPGCTLHEAGYSIEDEYGVHTGMGEFSVNGRGEFTVPVPVEAWREGQDKDGRIYKIKLFARNDAGIGTSDVLEAIVPHDKGKRPNSE